MHADAQLDCLLDQITELSDDAQTQLIQFLLFMRAEQLGLYDLDEDR